MSALFLDYGPWILAMAATGIAAEFVAGLLGVGGGIVMVPVLDTVLGAFGVDPAIRMKVAVASSLATNVGTSERRGRRQRRTGGTRRSMWTCSGVGGRRSSSAWCWEPSSPAS